MAEGRGVRDRRLLRGFAWITVGGLVVVADRAHISLTFVFVCLVVGAAIGITAD